MTSYDFNEKEAFFREETERLYREEIERTLCRNILLTPIGYRENGMIRGPFLFPGTPYSGICEFNDKRYEYPQKRCDGTENVNNLLFMEEKL